MFLLKEGVSLIIRRLSFNSDRNFYFPIRTERKSPNNERLVTYTMYTNINSLKLWQKSSRYGAMAGITQKGCVTLFPLWYFKKKQKTVVGYIDIKQQETYEKLKNRG